MLIHTHSLTHTYTWGYPCTLALTCSHPACIAQRCHFFGVGMQSWRDYFCKPCSAAVTSPQEDMEYRMGSCIGVARSQVTPHLSDTADRMAKRNENEWEDIAGCLCRKKKGMRGSICVGLGWRQGDMKEKAVYFWLSLLILACSGRSSGDEESERRREWKGKKRGRCKEMPDNICTVWAGKGMTDMDKWKALDIYYFRQDCNK